MGQTKIGTFAFGNRTGTLFEIEYTEDIGIFVYKSIHYKIIEDGTDIEYLVSWKGTDLVDSQGNIWKRITC